MPELPEVETIKNDLLKKVIGSQIIEVSYTDSGEKLKYKFKQNLANLIIGEKIAGIERRAKYLYFHLSGGKILVIHLKMTGQILIRESSTTSDQNTRIIFVLDDGREIRFTDRNDFGEIFLVEDVARIEDQLGPDSFEASYQQFENNLRSSKSGTIKEALLDQKIIAGVGNIYADEALYTAEINPFKSPKSLSESESHRLLNSTKEVLNDGLTHRGTTIDTFRDIDGKPGSHQFHLLVYGKAGKPCKKCATKIAYTEINGRRTHFCPTCQPKEQLTLF